MSDSIRPTEPTTEPERSGRWGKDILAGLVNAGRLHLYAPPVRSLRRRLHRQRRAS